MPRLREVMSLSGHEGTFAGYIGKIVVSHKTNYLCVALENDALLLLQLREDGTPLQFIVAHHPDLYNDELVWSNGDYFPFFAYHNSSAPVAEALRDSGFAMGGDQVYAAMVDDELGVRCAGIFTRYNAARHALECLIAKDEQPLMSSSNNPAAAGLLSPSTNVSMINTHLITRTGSKKKQ